MQLCSSLNIFWHCLSLRLEWKYLVQSCGHCQVFQICWHIKCSPFTASSFRTWNNSAGIPSPALALFIVLLPKAHLTLHSRMSGSRWVATLSWLFGSLRPLCTVLLCILATSSQSLLLLLDPYSFCPLSCPSLHEMFPWYLQFSRRDLEKEKVFPILSFSSISLHCSLKKAFLSLLAILWNSAPGISFPFLFAFHFSSFLI